jgi:hypothetical protein
MRSILGFESISILIRNSSHKDLECSSLALLTLGTLLLLDYQVIKLASHAAMFLMLNVSNIAHIFLKKIQYY